MASPSPPPPFLPPPHQKRREEAGREGEIRQGRPWRSRRSRIQGQPRPRGGDPVTAAADAQPTRVTGASPLLLELVFLGASVITNKQQARTQPPLRQRQGWQRKIPACTFRPTWFFLLKKLQAARAGSQSQWKGLFRTRWKSCWCSTVSLQHQHVKQLYWLTCSRMRVKWWPDPAPTIIGNLTVSPIQIRGGGRGWLLPPCASALSWARSDSLPRAIVLVSSVWCFTNAIFAQPLRRPIFGLVQGLGDHKDQFGVPLCPCSKEMGVVLKTNDEVVTFKAPQASAKAGFEFNQIWGGRAVPREERVGCSSLRRLSTYSSGFSGRLFFDSSLEGSVSTLGRTCLCAQRHRPPPTSSVALRYQHLGLVEDAGAQEVDQLFQLHEQHQADHLHRHREVKVTNDQLPS